MPLDIIMNITTNLFPANENKWQAGNRPHSVVPSEERNMPTSYYAAVPEG